MRLFFPAFKTLATAVAVTLLSACSTYTHQEYAELKLPATQYAIHRDLRYTPADWPEDLYVDIYVPRSADRRPAVLLVHGGGWERRSRADMDGIARKLASRGFVAVNVSYRFAPQHQFPAQLHDLQQAMHWLHDNAERFRIDTDRIAGLGYSAGAHLVSLLALVAGSDSELNTPHGGEQTRLAAVVAGGTPTDLRKFEGGTLVPQFLGGNQQQVPERYAQASPVTHVHAEAPPFFFYHGANDLLVPVDHATDFRAALKQKDITAELYLLRLRGHITAFLTGGGAIRAAMQFLYREMEVTPDSQQASAGTITGL